MRRLVLTISILLGAACTPGSGEYGSCASSADCQVALFCKPAIDAAGNEITDGGGTCRHSCQVLTDCANGEICNTTLQLCSSDGGY